MFIKPRSKYKGDGVKPLAFITGPVVMNVGPDGGTFKIQATDGPIEYGVDDLPAGFTVDASTGIITGNSYVGFASTVGLKVRNTAGWSHKRVVMTIPYRSLSVEVSGDAPAAEGLDVIYTASVSAGETGATDPGPYTYTWFVDSVEVQSGSSPTLNYSIGVSDDYRFSSYSQTVTCTVDGVASTASDDLVESVAVGDVDVVVIESYNNSQRTLNYAGVQSRSGVWRFYTKNTTNPQGYGCHYKTGWHRALQRWVTLRVKTLDYGTSTDDGIYISDTQKFNDIPPGAGWTKIHTITDLVATQSTNANDYLQVKGMCELSDGGLLYLVSRVGDYLPRALYVNASGTVSVIDPGLPYVNYYKLFSVRGSDRAFILGSGTDGTTRAIRYADPPYTAWSDGVEYNGEGTNTPWGWGSFHHGWGGIVRRTFDGRLIAFRPWMRYGSGSGSQAEIWSSTDNGHSWDRLPGAQGRPWGVYPSGDTQDHRAGSDTVFIDGYWHFFNWGDPLNIRFVKTSDWVTFQTTNANGAAYPSAPLIPDSITPGRLWAWGDKDGSATGWSMGDALVAYDDFVRNMGVAGLDGSFGGWFYPALRDNRPWVSELDILYANYIVTGYNAPEVIIGTLPAGNYLLTFSGGAVRWNDSPVTYAATRAAIIQVVGLQVWHDGSWHWFSDDVDEAATEGAAEALGAGKSYAFSLASPQEVKLRFYDGGPSNNTGSVLITASSV